jgi:hypothetical protein
VPPCTYPGAVGRGCSGPIGLPGTVALEWCRALCARLARRSGCSGSMGLAWHGGPRAARCAADQPGSRAWPSSRPTKARWATAGSGDDGCRRCGRCRWGWWGPVALNRPSGPRVSCQPPSWIARCWAWQTRARLARSAGPPSTQWTGGWPGRPPAVGWGAAQGRGQQGHGGLEPGGQVALATGVVGVAGDQDPGRRCVTGQPPTGLRPAAPAASTSASSLEPVAFQAVGQPPQALDRLGSDGRSAVRAARSSRDPVGSGELVFGSMGRSLSSSSPKASVGTSMWTTISGQ